MFRYVLLLILAACLSVGAQTTVTTTNAAGLTVVQVVTTNAAGAPQTQVVQTLTSAGTTATTPDPQGPVGAPAPTTGTPGAPTPYTYTTVLNGVTTTVHDIFTPTSPATVNVTVTGTGTILDYSSWLNVYGPPSTRKNTAPRATLPSASVLVIVAVSCWLAAH